MNRGYASLLALCFGSLLLLAACGGNTATPTPRPEAANPRHFAGKSAESWDQAIVHLREGKVTLAELVGREPLGPEDLHRVHELTYTLENAVERMRGELATLAETLEEVHIASETGDTATVARQGRRFIADLGVVVP